MAVKTAERRFGYSVETISGVSSRVSIDHRSSEALGQLIYNDLDSNSERQETKAGGIVHSLPVIGSLAEDFLETLRPIASSIYAFGNRY